MVETEEIILYDLEFTTWPGAFERNWSGQSEFREIVWIGALRVNTTAWEELDHFECVVRPSINPVLSDYFVALTGLSNADLDAQGVSFGEGIRNFHRFVGPRPMFCHGGDGLVLLENFLFNRMAFNARRLNDSLSIRIDLSKKGAGSEAKKSHAGNELLIRAYGPRPASPGTSAAVDMVYEISGVRRGHGADPMAFINFDVRPWLQENAPETQGLYSGQIAAALGTSVEKGRAHSPLYDARSVLQGIRHLILNLNKSHLVDRFRSILLGEQGRGKK